MDTAVGLVQAYLRVNGYFTVAEYPVLDATGPGGPRTITDLSSVPEHMLLEIEHFFSVYKDLEPGKSVEGATWTGREDAEDEVGASFERAKGTPYEHHHVNLA